MDPVPAPAVAVMCNTSGPSGYMSLEVFETFSRIPPPKILLPKSLTCSKCCCNEDAVDVAPVG